MWAEKSIGFSDTLNKVGQCEKNSVLEMTSEFLAYSVF